ncbi:aminoacyl-tRNA hydrolase [candidate division KSB1 bacterium]|nr:MAG: aminoacyl-tRNA hydrolase [candidate division KSB1 bacterium]
MHSKNKTGIELITFLGNPGNDYARTRHNIGMMVAEYISNDYSLSWQKKFRGLYSYINFSGRKIHLLQPETFMNKSGESIKPCSDFFKIDPENILVVHDEIELKFGVIDIKYSGGLGGHNGLRSIVQHLGTKDFFRLRIGVSKPQYGDVAGYVLSNFTSEEQEHIPEILTESKKAVELILKDPDTAIKSYRKKTVIQNQ